MARRCRDPQLIMRNGSSPPRVQGLIYTYLVMIPRKGNSGRMKRLWNGKSKEPGGSVTRNEAHETGESLRYIARELV